jgi:signal transduction histidine kinase
VISGGSHTVVFESVSDEIVIADPRLLRHLAANLISNAIKYSSQGSEVYVSLNKIDGTYVFVVRDQGIGIPPDDLPHLFEPFHRAGNVGTISGTGLGLAITKEAAELHGGKITVESEVQKGTTFTVHLPLSSPST